MLVLLISGNHNSPERLAFANRLMEGRGVYLCKSSDKLYKVNVGMRSDGAAPGRNRHKTYTDIRQQTFLDYGKIEKDIKIGLNPLQYNGFRLIKQNRQQQAITAFW